ncbi:putative ATP-dependent RNA helicase ECM32 [Bienertia sinuspersici]
MNCKKNKVLWDMCLSNACLIFCTASYSVNVVTNVEMVIIDKAAQLKESESIIPLRIPSVRNAVLIGDDRQLPAMIQSKKSLPTTSNTRKAEAPAQHTV